MTETNQPHTGHLIPEDQAALLPILGAARERIRGFTIDPLYRFAAPAPDDRRAAVAWLEGQIAAIAEGDEEPLTHDAEAELSSMAIDALLHELPDTPAMAPCRDRLTAVRARLGDIPDVFK